MLGLDFLGLGSKAWRIKEAVANWPDGWALGFFDGIWPDAFGDPRANVEAILATKRCPAIRVQMWWSYSHNGCPLDKLVKRLPVWEAIAKKWSVKVYISPSCEYGRSVPRDLVQKWVDAIRKLAPSCTPVLCPMDGPLIGGVMSEEHGSKATATRGQIASTDGQSLPDIDASRWMQQNHDADIVFGWANRFNLIEAHNTLPPSKRTAAPDWNYIQQVIRNMQPQGVAPMPTFQGKIVPIRKPFLYKVQAEDMPGPNGRDNKPLLIVKGKSRFCEAITKDGASLGRYVVFDNPGQYPGGLTRYYSGVPGALNITGVQLASKALQVSGSEFVWFKVDGVFYGPTNAAFRTGFYQA